jgi:very-short-patch-repair endonuclease
MDVEFICPKHGKQKMILDNLLRGHKCIECSYEERGINLRHDVQYVINYIESVNGNKLLNPEDYKDTTIRNLNIRCSCGNIFTTSFSNYSKHGVNTCYSCSCKESDGEQCIRKFLETNYIEFIQEKRFEDCRDNKPLPFDFYLPQYNLIIEFDGQLHYEPRFGMEQLIQTQKHDKIKNQYCKDNNINLLRIPYLDGHNIEEIISKQLNL